MDRRRYLAAVGAAATAGVGGCLGTAEGSEYDVGMRAVAYDPAELTVGVGETVVWENTSSRGHTVTAYEDGIPEDAAYFASGEFESEAAAREAWGDGFGGRLTTGDRFSHAFEVPGTYDYVCIPHEQGGMVGRVVVEG